VQVVGTSAIVVVALFLPKKEKRNILINLLLCMLITCLSSLLSFVLSAGIDFKIRTIELDNKKIKLQIW